MVGEKFNRLTVISQDSSKKNKKHRYYLCHCDCGKTVSVRSSDLRTGNTKSCGCLKRERLVEMTTTHGESKTKLYNVWNGMMTRCNNPKSDHFYRYGGRGIKVCDEWLHNYTAFRDWALSHGYEDGLTIDRIDVDGNYNPDNCRWITSAEQMKNTSANRLLTFNGETLVLADWARRVGLSPETISKRIKRGWSVEKTLTEKEA